MILQIIGIILAIIGYFTYQFWLFLVGGFLCLFLDIRGFASGKLNPLFPTFLYIGGYIIVGNWTGILWGSIIGNVMEVILILIGLPFFLRRKQSIKEKIETSPQSLNLAKELSFLYDELSIFSPRMQECNSEFIQSLHREAEEDEKYKNFKVAVLAVCLTKIEDSPNLKKYLSELDKAIDKLSEIVKEAIDKYDDGKGDFWKILQEKAGKEKYEDVLSSFYNEHFLTAQRMVLGCWLAKKRGDPLYLYKGLEPSYEKKRGKLNYWLYFSNYWICHFSGVFHSLLAGQFLF